MRSGLLNVNKRTRVLAAALLLSTMGLQGCAAHQAAHPSCLIGATCSPAARGTTTIEPTLASDPTIESTSLAFAPPFASTCRPDFQFTHLDLALAFVDARPTVAFDMVPLFSSTSSPGSRPWAVHAGANDVAKATTTPPSATPDVSATADADAAPR